MIPANRLTLGELREKYVSLFKYYYLDSYGSSCWDYYRILGLEREKKPTQEDINKAYTEAHNKYDPTNWPEDTYEGRESRKIAQRIYDQIGLAHAQLSDAALKSKYDLEYDENPLLKFLLNKPYLEELFHVYSTTYSEIQLLSNSDKIRFSDFYGSSVRDRRNLLENLQKDGVIKGYYDTSSYSFLIEGLDVKKLFLYVEKGRQEREEKESKEIEKVMPILDRFLPVVDIQLNSPTLYSTGTLTIQLSEKIDRIKTELFLKEMERSGVMEKGDWRIVPTLDKKSLLVQINNFNCEKFTKHLNTQEDLRLAKLAKGVVTTKMLYGDEAGLGGKSTITEKWLPDIEKEIITKKQFQKDTSVRWFRPSLLKEVDGLLEEFHQEDKTSSERYTLALKIQQKINDSNSIISKMPKKRQDGLKTLENQMTELMIEYKNRKVAPQREEEVQPPPQSYIIKIKQ